MKRMHLHLVVADLERSIAFYSALFAAEPSVKKSDYAKWRLEDPRVNFAISSRGALPGLDHLGIETDSTEEFASLAPRLAEAGRPLIEEQATACCYARSNKTWVEDPQGIAWEMFHTFGDSAHYGDDRPAMGAADRACCQPAASQPASCC